MDALLQKINVNPEIETQKYFYNGLPVPRITEILSAMLHDDYLMVWSNSLGFKHKSYKEQLDFAARIGSYTHETIEKYLTNSNEEVIIKSEDKNNRLLMNSLYNTTNSFFRWWDIIKQNNYEIIRQEESLVCPYFGGTYDLLIKINGKLYLVDFKTSNHVGYKHFIQLSAYRELIKIHKGLILDGVIILQLSKDIINFSEYILTFDNPQHLQYMDNCYNTFCGLVYSYWNRLYLEQQFTALTFN